MRLIDLRDRVPGYDMRDRAFTRPAVTTVIMILIAIMILRDVFHRRRQPAAAGETASPGGEMARHAA